MTKKTLFIFSILLMTVGAFASDTDFSGRDISDKGSLLTMEGTFQIDDSEWYLQTKDQLYIVHKGLDWYTEEIGFFPQEGEQITINGFVLGDEISPCTILIGSTSYAFRDSEGSPLWGGRGNRSNERLDGNIKEEEVR